MRRKLSEHFTLEELIFSQTAMRKGIDNTPAPDIVRNLRRLAGALEDVRALLGAPVVISSGFRGEALNRAVGGARNSAHMRGLAAILAIAQDGGLQRLGRMDAQLMGHPGSHVKLQNAFTALDLQPGGFAHY